MRAQSWEALLHLRGELEQTEALIKASHDARRHKEELEIISKIKSEPAVLYGYAKRHAKNPTQVGPLQGEDGSHITNTEEMAKILRKQYDSVFATPTEELNKDFLDSLFEDSPPEESPKLQSITFSLEGV